MGTAAAPDPPAPPPACSGSLGRKSWITLCHSVDVLIQAVNKSDSETVS